jgi:hypothetical protein
MQVDGIVIEVEPGDEVIIPLSVVSDISAGAISLILEYPENIMEIQGVYLKDDMNSEVPFHIQNNHIRIGWFSSDELFAASGNTLLSIKVKIRPDASFGLPVNFKLVPDQLNEIGDMNMNVVENVVLSIPFVSLNLTGLSGQFASADRLLMTVYPNPANENVYISYTLPTRGNVHIEIFDQLGKRVDSMSEKRENGGKHNSVFDVRSWSSGVYVVRLSVENDSGILTGVDKIIIHK